MLIYKLEVLWAVRDWRLRKPVQTAALAGVPEFYLRQIENFVRNYFWGKVDIGGITRDFAKLYMCREFLKSKWVHKTSSDVAYWAAKVNFKAFMSSRAAAVGWLAIGLAVAGVLVILIYAIGEWIETKQGHFAYPEGACVFRYRERLWWGGVVGRPTEREWDVQICREMGAMFFFEGRLMGSGFGRTDIWDFGGLWEWTWAAAVGWHVYRAGDMRVVFLGKGVDRGLDRYRITVPVGKKQPWSMPVGWGIREFAACEYLLEPWKLFVAR